MSTWWQHFGMAGAATEADMGHGTGMPPGSASMIVGVYVGLVLGTMDPMKAGRIRRELEAEMVAAMDVPAESLEAEMRQLVAAVVAREGR